MTIFVDVFPIQFDLKAYPLAPLHIEADNRDEIGATFAAQVRTRRNVPCAWVKEEQILIAPVSFSSKSANEVLNELWNAKIEGFDQVIRIDDIVGWQVTAESVAQFVAIGMADKAQAYVRNVLRSEKLSVKMIGVQRVADFKGIVVYGQPSLQITVRSEMDSTVKLSAVFDAQSPIESIKNRSVKCKNTPGIAQKQAGVLDDQMRVKLKGYSPKDYDVSIFDRLPYDHPVIEVKKVNGSKKYLYPLEVLDVSVNMANLSTFGLVQSEINKITYRLKIAPDLRFQLVSKVKEAFSTFLGKEYSSVTLGERYNSVDQPELFTTAKTLGLQTELRFANGTATITKDTELLIAIKRYGIYKKPLRFETNNLIKVGVVDAIVGTAHGSKRNDQLKRFQQFMKTLNLELKSTSPAINIQERENHPAIVLRKQLTTAIKKHIQLEADLIMVYLPDSDYDEDDETSLYNIAKSICIEAKVAS